MTPRVLALGGLTAAAAGPLAVGALHVLPPTSAISPIRRTISEYALHETAWLFNLGVSALAVGSLAVLFALSRAGTVRLLSLGGAGLLLWCAGLAGVVYFPKHNWAIGPSVDGDIHRGASLVAFVSLPLGALAIAWAWRREPVARLAGVFAVLALLCFGVIAGAWALQPVTGVRWFRAIPLGAVERALATAEVLIILTLGWWARTPVPAPTLSPVDHEVTVKIPKEDVGLVLAACRVAGGDASNTACRDRRVNDRLNGRFD